MAVCGILVLAACTCVSRAAEESKESPGMAATWAEISPRCWRVGADKLNLGDNISREDVWTEDVSGVGSILILLRSSIVIIPDEAGPAIECRIEGLEYSKGDWLVSAAAASVRFNVKMRMRVRAEKAVIATTVSEKPLRGIVFPGFAPAECDQLSTCYPVDTEYVLRKLDVVAQDDVPDFDFHASRIKAEIRTFKQPSGQHSAEEKERVKDG